MSGAPGVTFVVPVLNGRRWLRMAIEGIRAQRDGRPFEIVAIDDGSSDGSQRVLRQLEASGELRLVHGAGRGAAAAINAGIREARHPIICQVDQDVILQPGWLTPLLSALEDPDVAAAQGHYVTRAGAGFWARAMGRDLEHRYSRIRGPFVDHVCTGNTAYRASALHQAGLLDEQLGYGYDNDLSYRLVSRGHRLAFCRDAISVHCWREGFRGYMRQQFGVGYGRLDVLARHPGRCGGDDVSGTVMMLHGPAMLAAIAALGIAAAAALGGFDWTAPASVAAAIITLLVSERTLAGFTAWRSTGDAAALAFSFTHLMRDLAWAAAILLWVTRRSLQHAAMPLHSMHRRAAAPPPHLARDAARSLPPGSLLAVVPAYNEAANLRRVVADLRRAIPSIDILIVDDGSTDDTAALLPALDVRWLALSQRLGVGGAVRAGIRFGLQHGYDFVVRVDGDAQHRACDVARLLAPVAAGEADAAIGSRFTSRRSGRGGMRRWSQAALAACLSAVTGRRVTDPTSGFWLFGPRALRLLGRHHPAGYAEPELALLLSRNGLRVSEVPIRMRPRIAGRTSLTASRAMLAFARTALAFVVVPFRRIIDGYAGD